MPTLKIVPVGSTQAGPNTRIDPFGWQRTSADLLLDCTEQSTHYLLNHYSLYRSVIETVKIDAMR